MVLWDTSEKGDGEDGPESVTRVGEDSCFGIGYGVWFLKFGIITSFGGCVWWSQSGHRFKFIYLCQAEVFSLYE